MNLTKLKEVLEEILDEVNNRPVTQCEISTKWNKQQKIYFMNRILDVSGMIHCGHEMSIQLEDMLDTWKESECKEKKLCYIYEIAA